MKVLCTATREKIPIQIQASLKCLGLMIWKYDVTATQAAGLAITGVATIAMAFAAFQMKRKVDGNCAVGGRLANDAAVFS